MCGAQHSQHAYNRQMRLVADQAAVAAADSKWRHRSRDGAPSLPSEEHLRPGDRSSRRRHHSQAEKPARRQSLAFSKTRSKPSSSTSASPAASQGGLGGSSSPSADMRSGADAMQIRLPRSIRTGVSGAARRSGHSGIRRTVQLQQHATPNSIKPARASSAPRNLQRGARQQRQAGSAAAQRITAELAAPPEGQPQYLLTMVAAFHEAGSDAGTKSGFFNGTVTQLSGADRGRTEHQTLAAGLEAASAKSAAAALTAKAASASLRHPDDVAAAALNGDTGRAACGGMRDSAVVWRENPTLRITRESSFYSAETGDGSGAHTSGGSRSRNGGSRSSNGGASESGGSSSESGAKGPRGPRSDNWRNNALADIEFAAGSATCDGSSGKQSDGVGSAPHLLDIDDATAAAGIAARGTAGLPSSKAGSSGSGDSSEDGSGEGAAPLIDLAPADSGRLRTATMDSDCPTGLQFATAAGDVAWPQVQPQVQPLQQHAKKRPPPTTQQQVPQSSLPHSGSSSARATGLLLVPVAPERISEGGGGLGFGFSVAHPAAEAAAAEAAANAAAADGSVAAEVGTAPAIRSVHSMAASPRFHLQRRRLQAAKQRWNAVRALQQLTACLSCYR